MNKYIVIQNTKVLEIVHAEDDVTLAVYMQRTYGGAWRWNIGVFLITNVVI